MSYLRSLCTVFLLLIMPASGSAFDGFDFYIAPSVGYSWFKVKSMEIEKKFIAPTKEEQDQEVDRTDTQRLVGSKSMYSASGISLGGSAGLKIFSLGLGVHYSWTPASTDGYSKHYHYYTEEGRAGGRKFHDSLTVDLQRVLFELSYFLPISRLHIVFGTRIGGLFIDDNGLVIGRAIDQGTGFTGDLGLRLDFYPLSFMAICLGGWFGFFYFDGSYEGTYGTAGGLNANLLFKI